MDGEEPTATYGASESDKIVADERTKLLSSPMFARSPVLSRLLAFLVDHRLRGGRVAPKAYAIATEALGRSADFDPAVDSYPRVMVGRLRNLLDRYYAETAWVHRLRLPQGSYEIIVQHRVAPPAATGAAVVPPPPLASDVPSRASGSAVEAPKDEQEVPLPVVPPAIFSHSGSGVGDGDSRQFGYAILLIALISLAVFAGWWFGQSRDEISGNGLTPAPMVEISRPVSGDSGQSRAMARALDSKLRDGLRRFEMIRLLSARGTSSSTLERHPDFRIEASLVRTVEGPVVVTLVLNRVIDERTIWSQQVRLGSDDIPEYTALEPAIAQIAGDYGVIVRDQVQRQPTSFAPGFPCLAQFNHGLQMPNGPAKDQIHACLQASLEQAPQDPVVLSALSLLRFGDWQLRRNTPAGKVAFAEAQDLAVRAYDSSPDSATGLFAMARYYYYSGDCIRGSSAGNSALERNPFDADITGFQGLFRLACNDVETSETLLRRSLRLDASHGGVAAVTLAFMVSQQGDQVRAMDILDRMPSPSNLEPQYMVVRAIVLARQSEIAKARRIWRRLLIYTRQPADAPPEQVLRQFMIMPAVIDRASSALREAGVTVQPTG